MAKFNVHAGHGKQDSKSCGAIGLIKESVENRLVKDEVIRLLKAEGHTVYDCTVDYPNSASDCVSKQVANCNKNKVDLDISIHFNAGRKDPNGDNKTGGVEVLVCNTTGTKQEYAKRVCASVSKLGYTNRGVKVTTKLGYLNKVTNQCILIECCFVDDADDIKKYNYKTMAKAIVEGILNKTISTTQTTTQTNTNTNGKELYYQVVCGSYKNKSNAETMKAKLVQAGFKDVFLEANYK